MERSEPHMRVCWFGAGDAHRDSARARTGLSTMARHRVQIMQARKPLRPLQIREKEKTKRKKSRTSRKNEKENPGENRADSRPRQGLALILSPPPARL